MRFHRLNFRKQVNEAVARASASLPGPIEVASSRDEVASGSALDSARSGISGAKVYTGLQKD